MNDPRYQYVDFRTSIENVDFVEFSVRSLPERSVNFWDDLVQTLRFSSKQDLLEVAKLQYEYLDIIPVIPIHDFCYTQSIHAGDIASIFVLARCSEALFLRRRRPALTYEQLQKKIYVSRDHILVLKNRKSRSRPS